MITCTQCGAKNSDDTLYCKQCNKKLQSTPRQADETPVGKPPLERFEHEGISEDNWKSLRRMLEAWAYLIALVLVAAGCAFYEIWWPMYPTVLLLGVLIWLRRV